MRQKKSKPTTSSSKDEVVVPSNMITIDSTKWPRRAELLALVLPFPDYLRAERSRKYRPKSILRFMSIMNELMKFLFSSGKDIGPLNILVSALLRFSEYGNRHPKISANSTTKLRRVVIRVFYEYLARRKYPVPNMKELLPLQKFHPNEPRPLTDEQVLKIYGALNPNTKEGLRNLVIVETLFGTGIRVSSLENANVGSVDLNSSQPCINVTGKGGKQKSNFLTKAGQVAIKLYLSQRPKATRDSPLVLSRTGTRLTARGIQYALKRIAVTAGLDVNVTPHILRHTFASHLWANGCDILTIQDLLDHFSLETTKIYTKLAKKRQYSDFMAAHSRNHVDPMPPPPRETDQDINHVTCNETLS